MRTIDGGAHWRDAGPSGVELDNAWAVLDADHAVVTETASEPPSACPQPPNAGLDPVARTADGGRSWTVVGYNHASHYAGAWTLTFIDRDHAWQLSPDQPASQFTEQAALVERTVDGGRSWTTLSEAQYQHEAGMPFKCGKRSLAFADASNGFIGQFCLGAAPGLLVSHDGGHTWQDVQLLGGGEPSDCDVPRFPTPTDGYLSCNLMSGRAVVFATHDAGYHWRTLTLPAAQASTLAVINAMDLYLCSDRLYRTADRGVHWYAVGAVPACDGLDVAGLTDGFALGGQAFDGPRPMLRTQDGGRTWRSLSPQLAP